MKDEIRDLLANIGILFTGHYTRMQFSKSHFTWRQNLALFLCGGVVIFVVHLLKIEEIYKLSIVMVISLILPNIINAVMNKGDKIAKNLTDKLDKFS